MYTFLLLAFVVFDSKTAMNICELEISRIPQMEPNGNV